MVVGGEPVLYPGEGHGINNPRHMIKYQSRELEWFRYYLLGDKSASGGGRIAADGKIQGEIHMSEKRGCFKTGCLGCLGVLAAGAIFLGITAIVAMRGAGNKDVVDRDFSAVPDSLVAQGQAGEAILAAGGKLVLMLSQGEFQIHPAPAGETLTIKANFDDDIYNLEHKLETLPDSTWVYQVRFYRTIGGLQALMRQIVGGGHDNSIHIYIPPDVPIELVIDSQEGGFEAELGGLWLTSADIKFAKGGFALEISDPLREPMDSLMIRGSMGGFDAQGIGNASPRVIGVSCSMGGAQIDLNGNWRNDCDAMLAVKMGGMAVIVPDDVIVQGVEVQGGGMRPTDSEVPIPVLNLSLSQSMGEIEVIR